MSNMTETMSAPMQRALALITAALVAMALLVGCAGSATSKSTGEYIDDSAITAKVKAAIAERLGITSVANISVETFKGVVQLSGFVDTPSVKVAAAEEARTVNGVQRVENKISVK